MSCKLNPCSLQKTRLPPRPRLPKRIRNTHLRNHYGFKGKDIDVYFSFLSRGIILWIELPWPENPANIPAWHTETLDNCFDLIRSHQQCIPWSLPLEIEPATTDCRAENGDRVLCKKYGFNLQDTFRLIGRAITMTIWRHLCAKWTVGSVVEFQLCNLW